jgi:hypothetical protein
MEFQGDGGLVFGGGTAYLQAVTAL